VTIFIRLLDDPVGEKGAALKGAVRGDSTRAFDVDLSDFSKVPGSPFAYWVPHRALEVFIEFPPAHGESRLVVSTNPLNADFRFVRVWWEVRTSMLNERWRPWAKGGARSPFHYDIDTIIRWSAERQTYAGFLGTENRPLERPASLQHFFRPGLTWPRRTNGLSFRLMPKDCIFADKGPAVFVSGDEEPDLQALCALMNSAPFAYLVSVQLARTELAQSYEVGLIQQTPVPDFGNDDRSELAELGHRAWSLRRFLDSTNERSHSFVLPAALMERRADFRIDVIEREIAFVQAKIDDIVFRLYGFSGDDRKTIETWDRGYPQGNCEVVGDELNTDQAADEEDGNDIRIAGKMALLSWAAGVAHGRFDIRLATGERTVPLTLGPFDPLPSISPAMLPEEDPPFMPCHGVLVDDLGHEDDLTTRVLAVYERIGEASPEPQEVRRTLAREFFSAHIKMYSKSRRKAPIYWQLATASASYSVWVYIHTFTKDTIFRIQNDYVAPKLGHELRQLEALRGETSPNPNSAQRRLIEMQEAFVEELQTFLDEVKRVAPLWNPDLDDGVIINFAPLWRLVPQNRTWQKELRATWDALARGDYDWAHLAMHLWPERVVPKCATDRSLAIAHDLEDVFWFENADGKWKPREKPTRSIDEIIKERTSPAVKDALRSLTQAAVTAGTPKRGRKRAA
jgi:hypothetical protein